MSQLVSPQITVTITYEAQLCRHLDRRERCRQFDTATAICEATADMHHLGDVDDDDSLSEDPEHEPK